MKYKNAIISTGKDILIVFICFFIFMFLSGGGTQNVLAAEDEVTITLDANGGKAVEPVVYKKTQSEIGILPETTERTQKEVADILGISQSYISRLEKKIMGRLKKEMNKLM